MNFERFDYVASPSRENSARYPYANPYNMEKQSVRVTQRGRLREK